ncbi:cupin domain-containing protein [Phototrophicus methaneseepsis]|uniref:Cupin domain-containing protein n=1 Tax=Phototrophicus methaneseepsis TaxID=2710758 RepID=A0A7S8EB54_9CHLR|nr:cupin domain-containing protein [Phototrophicus methaneseepsis]QPC83711.1 cupin domain-containing protein [Phototrophicus methaneseepsis]
MSDYTLIPALEELIDVIQPDSIVSRTFHRDCQFKTILFGFDAGQELSEHTSSQAAIIQIVKGDATVTLGEDTHELTAGAWVHMPPRLKHSITAKTPLLMLLLMFETTNI